MHVVKTIAQVWSMKGGKRVDGWLCLAKGVLDRFSSFNFTFDDKNLTKASLGKEKLH